MVGFVEGRLAAPRDPGFRGRFAGLGQRRGWSTRWRSARNLSRSPVNCTIARTGNGRAGSSENLAAPQPHRQATRTNRVSSRTRPL